MALYHERGEAERQFGEFQAAFEPNFRHAQKRKNEAWAQLLALAHNVMVDLRAKLPTGLAAGTKSTAKSRFTSQQTWHTDEDSTAVSRRERLGGKGE